MLLIRTGMVVNEKERTRSFNTAMSFLYRVIFYPVKSRIHIKDKRWNSNVLKTF
jgi:hypothetical protein